MGNVKHKVLIIKHFISKEFYFCVYCYLIHMNVRVIVVVTALIQRYAERLSLLYLYILAHL
jgi:hypothetical protein